MKPDHFLTGGYGPGLQRIMKIAYRERVGIYRRKKERKIDRQRPTRGNRDCVERERERTEEILNKKVLLIETERK